MGSNDGTNFLAGNPILLTILAGRYRIYTGADYSTLIFDGNVFSLTTNAVIDVTDLFSNMKEDAGVTFAKMVVVDSLGVEHTDEANGVNVYKFVVFGGAISKALIRKLISLETDIFNWKLKNSATNFFLTTRTNSQLIFIPENELQPLYFYPKGLNFQIKYNGTLVETYDYSAETTDRLESIDLTAIRLLLANTLYQFISIFTVTTEDGNSCQIIITEAQKTDYYLKFKNSWGVMEKIALSEKISFTPVFNEVTKTSKWDDTVGAFTERNERKQLNNSYTSGLGYKTEAERLFLIDLLFSNDVLFIAHDQEYKVNVSADMTKIISTDGIPVDISLIIELIDKETNFSDLSTIEIAPNINDRFEYSLPFNL
ncbi:MAG: hypothetical protein WBJ13_08780 [Sedimentibacter sp.]